jgi:hypothetical protein
MLWTAEKAGRTVLSTDFSSYDASIPPWMIVDGCKVLGSWIQGHESVLERLGVALAYNTSLLTPSKFYEPQPSSMKSGSGLTNIIDGIDHLLVQVYGDELGLYKIVNGSIQGDDGLLDGPGVSPETFSEAASHFGIVANASKQFFVPRALTFLQKLHILGAPGGIGSVSRSLGSALNYERMRFSRREWNKYAETVQTISKLETAAFNPYFVELVHFIQSGDKYKLWADIPAAKLLEDSGPTGSEVLERQFQASINRPAVEAKDGFSQALTNGVLRGETPPPFGTVDRFSRVYGSRADPVMDDMKRLLAEIGSFDKYWN